MVLNDNEQSHVLFKLSGKGIPDIIVIDTDGNLVGLIYWLLVVSFPINDMQIGRNNQVPQRSMNEAV